MKPVHSQRIERWLGAEQAALLSEKMRGFHAPIAVANTPEPVYVMPDGDFAGRMLTGSEATLRDKLADAAKRNAAIQRMRIGQAFRQRGSFSSLGDLVSEATNGKQQNLVVGKAGVTGVANIANSLWDVGAQPAAGAVTAATEVVPTNATVGGLRQNNAAGGDTLHFASATMVGTVANNCLLLYDLFYYYVHNIATQNVSSLGSGGNAPTRYQDSTAAGTFATAFVTVALAGTPGTYQLNYVDDAGNTAENNTAQTLVAASIARRFPFAATVGNGWFLPLNSGDVGLRRLAGINQSVSTGTGQIMIALAKPIVWIPIPIANTPVIVDGVQGAFNLSRVVDNACLALMEINKGATTATNYSGQIILVSG